MSRQRLAAAVQVAVAGLVFLAIACIAYRPLFPFSPDRLVGDCACSDAVQQAWFLRWTAFALGHGLDPFFTSYMNAPDGANLAVNTSMPLLGLLGWPVTAVGGSIAAFNVLLRVGLALSALSMYLVLRRYVASRAAAFVGALLFGFSPYMLAEGQLHVFLTFLPLLPPLIPLIDRWLVTADGNPWRCGALIGLLLGLEMLISAELAVVFIVFALIALIPIAIRHRRLLRSRLPRLLRGLVSGAGVGLLVGGYLIWMFVAGPQRPHGPPHSVANLDSYHADLLSLVLPSTPQLLRPPILRTVADGFVRGNVHENGFYIGIPLLVILAVGAVRLRRSTLALSVATLGVVSFLLGLGVSLSVANHDTHIPLPLALITGIPMLQEIGPTRFALSIQIAAAVLLALIVDRLVQRYAPIGWRGPALVAAVSLVAMVPLLPNGRITSTKIPAAPYFASSSVTAVQQGATLLPYPYAYYSNNDAMLWQVASDMRFRMPGGEIYAPKANGRSTNYPRNEVPPSLWAVLVQGGPNQSKHWTAPAASERPALVTELRTYTRAQSIDAIAVSAKGKQGRWVRALTTSAFGAPTTVEGGLDVWLKPKAP